MESQERATPVPQTGAACGQDGGGSQETTTGMQRGAQADRLLPDVKRPDRKEHQEALAGKELVISALNADLKELNVHLQQSQHTFDQKIQEITNEAELGNATCREQQQTLTAQLTELDNLRGLIVMQNAQLEEMRNQNERLQVGTTELNSSLTALQAAFETDRQQWAAERAHWQATLTSEQEKWQRTTESLNVSLTEAQTQRSHLQLEHKNETETLEALILNLKEKQRIQEEQNTGLQNTIAQMESQTQREIMGLQAEVQATGLRFPNRYPDVCETAKAAQQRALTMYENARKSTEERVSQLQQLHTDAEATNQTIQTDNQKLRLEVEQLRQQYQIQLVESMTEQRQLLEKGCKEQVDRVTAEQVERVQVAEQHYNGLMAEQMAKWRYSEQQYQGQIQALEQHIGTVQQQSEQQTHQRTAELMQYRADMDATIAREKEINSQLQQTRQEQHAIAQSMNRCNTKLEEGLARENEREPNNLAKMQAEYDNLQAAWMANKEEVQELQLALNTCRETLNAKMTQLTDCVTDQSILQNKLQYTDDELQVTMANHKENEALLAQYRSEFEKVSGLLITANVTIATLKDANQALTVQLQRQQTEFEARRATDVTEQMEAEMIALRTEGERLRSELATTNTLVSQLQVYADTYPEAEERLAECHERATNQNARMHELTLLVEDMNERNVTNEATILRLQTEQTRMHAELERMRAEELHYRMKVTHLETESRKREDRFAKYQLQVSAENDKLNEQIATLTAREGYLQAELTKCRGALEGEGMKMSAQLAQWTGGPLFRNGIPGCANAKGRIVRSGCRQN